MSQFHNNSQYCNKFGWATGQSNLTCKCLVNKKLPKFGTHITALWPMEQSFHSVCEVLELPSGPPELFTFSCYAWLWNCLIRLNSFTVTILYEPCCPAKLHTWGLGVRRVEPCENNWDLMKKQVSELHIVCNKTAVGPVQVTRHCTSILSISYSLRIG